MSYRHTSHEQGPAPPGPQPQSVEARQAAKIRRLEHEARLLRTILRETSLPTTLRQWAEAVERIGGMEDAFGRGVAASLLSARLRQMAVGLAAQVRTEEGGDE